MFYHIRHRPCTWIYCSFGWNCIERGAPLLSCLTRSCIHLRDCQLYLNAEIDSGKRKLNNYNLKLKIIIAVLGIVLVIKFMRIQILTKIEYVIQVKVHRSCIGVIHVSKHRKWTLAKGEIFWPVKRTVFFVYVVIRKSNRLRCMLRDRQQK